MKILVLSMCLALVGGQAQKNEDVTILRSEHDNKGDGTFSWLSELSDGTKLEQRGYIKDGPDPENPIQVIEGAYQYYSPEGDLIQVKYIADENGFQPEGAHLPTPPPIPPEIQKALDIIYSNVDKQQTAASRQNNVFARPKLSPPRRF